MKLINTSKIAIAGVALLAGSVAFGQKKTETDAALAFKSYETALQSQDMVNAKKSLLKAKGFIDAASTNAETENSAKTLFYKGEIYASIQVLRALGDTEFNSSTPDNAISVAVAAYNKAYTTSDKFDGDIENSVGTILMMGDTQAKTLFDGGKFEDAAKIYAMNAEVGGAVGRVDTIYYYYAAIASQNAKDWPNTAKYYRKCAEMNYMPEQSYLNAATAYVNAKEEGEAKKFLEESITKAPKNKYLYYVLGTIYMDDKDDAKVEENLKKAIEIDPQFSDAQFNLGSYFFTKGMEIRRTADNETDRTKQKEILANSITYLDKAFPALEAYVVIVPGEREVLKSLWQISRAKGDTEKEAKYKKLMDEAK